MITEKIRKLIGQMILEEKAGLLSGADFWHTKDVERLGIPATMVSDGPHGLRKQDLAADHLGINDSVKAVCYPAASAAAASFDPDMLEEIGKALGESCQHEGLSVLLKNEGGLLPLSREDEIAFIGDFAEKPRFQGGGSSHKSFAGLFHSSLLIPVNSGRRSPNGATRGGSPPFFFSEGN